MSLKISAPKDEPTDKQKKFIIELCLNLTQPMPNFDRMTFSEASELIEELVEANDERLYEWGDRDDSYKFGD